MNPFLTRETLTPEENLELIDTIGNIFSKCRDDGTDVPAVLMPTLVDVMCEIRLYATKRDWDIAKPNAVTTNILRNLGYTEPPKDAADRILKEINNG